LETAFELGTIDFTSESTYRHYMGVLQMYRTFVYACYISIIRSLFQYSLCVF